MGTSIDYSAVSHETIYQHITGGPGGTELMDASRGWQSVAARLRELHGTIELAIRGIGAAQQGAAADAATHATMALMPWLENSVSAADGMAARISHQADSFGRTRDTMPTPVVVPEVSFRQDPGGWLGEHAVEWLPGIQTEHERAEVAAQQAQEWARELMSGYQSTSNSNLAIGQDFVVAPAVVADVSDPAWDGSGVGAAPVGGSAPLSSPHPTVAHPTVAHPTVAHAAPAAHWHAATVAPAGTAPQVAAGVHQAPAAATSPPLAGGYLGPPSRSGTGSGQIRPGLFGAAPMPPGSDAAGGHRGLGGSRAAGGGFPAGRGGGFGPRPSAALDAPHALAGGAGAHTGDEHNGRAARGGAGGWAGAPLGATGGAGRDSETERRRPSYLIEQDSSAIVGDLPPVAPPVIGED